MNWYRLKQQEEYLTRRVTWRGSGLNGDVYKDHLLILGDGKREDVLCCWNISKTFLLQFDSDIFFSERNQLLVEI